MALEFRSLDGTGNNLQHAEFNQPVGTPFVRDTAPVLDRLDDGSPNARLISNLVVGQGNPNVDHAKLSEAATLWGQFVDHDLDLNRSDGVHHIDIAIPPGDPAFTNPIQVTRGVTSPATGTFVNSITGFLDGSQVYGSTQAAADALKAADGAHLKTSDGDNLPIDATGRFVAGDVRVQENPYLTSWQTLFLREHNFQVDKLEAQHHDWTSEHLYQQARAVVTAEIQDITYNEWLPHILGGNGIGVYHGYNPNVDPRISQEFAVAAFRWGHSGIDETIDHVDAHGGEISQSLTDAFKLPATEFTTLGADGFIRSQIADHMQVVDARIVDSLRDGLFDPNGPADLAAINIQRGRDANIGTLNDVRHDLGLKEYTKFEQISSDKATVAALKEAYHGDVNAIDFWVGGLAEKHVNGGELGQTFNTVVKHQFADLRAGDRLYFENQGFSKAEIRDIKHTSLGDIIERNTDVDLPHGQKDVFVAKAIPTHDIEKAASPAPEKVAGLALDQGAPDKARTGEARRAAGFRAP
jgi:peroxidase